MYKSPITLNAQQLRHELSEERIQQICNYPRNNVHIVLDGVVDTFNIGAAARVADSIFAQKLWICGPSVNTIVEKQVLKSSVNTIRLIESEIVENTVEIFDRISGGYFIALEKLANEKFQNIRNISGICHRLQIPIVIIVGSENAGISEKVLNRASAVVEIPQLGVNHSMNVINALTLICYSVMGLV